jgi:predicted ArsR family transcriptional regulator
MSGLRRDETEATRAELLSALGGKYSEQILAAANSPKSAQALSDEVDIPIATCYRRIEELVEAGLLKSEGRQLSEQGRRTNVYRRTVDELAVDFTTEDFTIDLEHRSEAKNQLQGSYE